MPTRRTTSRNISSRCRRSISTSRCASERSRATGLLMSQSQWTQERGAITQEVTQDKATRSTGSSSRCSRDHRRHAVRQERPGYGRRIRARRQSAQLLRFYQRWYHPNNAVYVIVGDVDPAGNDRQGARALRRRSGSAAAARASRCVCSRFTRATLSRHLRSAVSPPCMLGYRLPGYDSPDYAAGADSRRRAQQSAQRTSARCRSPGKALGDGVLRADAFRRAAIGIAVRRGAGNDASRRRSIAQMRGDHRRLQARAACRPIWSRRRSCARSRKLEFSGNSIEGLADEWSQAIAVQGLHSPDDMIAQFDAVTRRRRQSRAAQVSRQRDRVVAAYAVPKNAGAAEFGGGGMAKENNDDSADARTSRCRRGRSTCSTHLHVPEQTLASDRHDALERHSPDRAARARSRTPSSCAGEILNNPQRAGAGRTRRRRRS